MSVVASGGTGSLSYVWKKAGTVIAGKTTPTVGIAAAAAAGDAGSYTCEVSDSASPTPVKIISTACAVTVTV